MTKYLFVLIILFFLSTDNKTPLGEFLFSTGTEFYRLTLKKDSSFSQYYGNCMERTLAEGKWTINKDTIMLNALNVYALNGRRKKYKQDTSSYFYKQFFYYHNKVMALGTDTVLQLRLHYKSTRFFKLVKQN